MEKFKPRPRPGDNNKNEEIITGDVMTISEYEKLFNFEN